MKKTYIIPLIASGTFVLGLICLFVPFLPFGWLLMFMTALLLAPYFAPIKQLLLWLIKRDKTGAFNKAREKVVELYHWVGDSARAKELKDFHNTTED